MATRRTALAALVLAGCGAGTPAPPKPAVPVAPRVVARDAPPEVPDLSPAPEPAELVLVARLAEGGDALQAPFRVPAEALLEAIAPGLPRGLHPILDPSQSVELAVAVESPETLLGRGPDVAVSVALESLQAGLELFRAHERDGGIALTRRGPSVYAVGAPDDLRPMSCVLAASVGAAASRLICGTHPRALELLAPYMARTLPVRELGDEPLVVELRARRFAQQHGAALSRSARLLAPLAAHQLGGPRHSTFVSVALPTLLDEALAFAGDASVVRLSWRPDPAGGGIATLRSELETREAWSSRTLASLATRPDSAREMFARLPADSELAWFNAGADPARTAEARGALTQWLRAFFGPEAHPETLDLITRTFLPEPPAVYAQGDAHGRDSAQHAGGRSIWEKTRATFGWHIAGYDTPAQQMRPKLDAGMKNYNSGPFRELAYRELAYLCPGLPKITSRPAGRGLPPGSQLYEMKLPGKFFDDCAARSSPARDPSPPGALAVLMVPDAKRTWIAFGPDEADLRARLAALLKSGAASPSGSAPELALLREPSVQAGGFFTLGGLGGLGRFLTMQEPWAWRRERMRRLPHAGRTPVPVALSVAPGTPTAVTLRATLSAAALQDLQQHRW